VSLNPSPRRVPSPKVVARPVHPKGAGVPAEFRNPPRPKTPLPPPPRLAAQFGDPAISKKSQTLQNPDWPFDCGSVLPAPGQRRAAWSSPSCNFLQALVPFRPFSWRAGTREKCGDHRPRRSPSFTCGLYRGAAPPSQPKGAPRCIRRWQPPAPRARTKGGHPKIITPAREAGRGQVPPGAHAVPCLSCGETSSCVPRLYGELLVPVAAARPRFEEQSCRSADPGADHPESGRRSACGSHGSSQGLRPRQ